MRTSAFDYAYYCAPMSSAPSTIRATDVVAGYHGTDLASARTIVSDGFHPSSNNYDWLGTGIYFWERAPNRARQWARQRFGSDACVIRASIDLRDCLDLTDTGHEAELKAGHAMFAAQVGQETYDRLAAQQKGKARRLDCAVLNFVLALWEEHGRAVRSVRAAFGEGSALWAPPTGEPSGILDRSHVQLAVRDPSVILDISVS